MQRSWISSARDPSGSAMCGTVESPPVSTVAGGRVPRWASGRWSKNSWLSLDVFGRTRLGNDENLVAESLCHKADRDSSECLPDEVFNVRCRNIERDNRNLTTASAELDNLGV